MTLLDRPPLLRPSRLALAAVLALAVAATAGAEAESRPFVQVTGDRSIQVEPDEAMVRIGIESEATNARQAQLETNRIGGAILAAISELGVDSRAVQTAQLSLWPVYESRPPESHGEHRPRIVAYRATNTVSVRLDDLTLIGPVVDAAIGAGANRIQGLDLGLRDDTAARRRALAAAVEEARGKAETIAEALGVRLGPVLEANDQGVQVPRIQMQQRALELAAADASTPVATGTITVSATVLLRFAIEQD